MKKTSIAYIFLCFLPLVITIGVSHYVYDLIPAHYNAAGQIDRWGNKSELLIFPITTIIIGIIFLVSALLNNHRLKAEGLACD